MKTFKQFREETSYKDKERKSKKTSTIEIMPRIRDGEKGMVKPVTNEGFAGNYDGPLYAPHPDIKRDK
jgi:hypothetical protein